MNAYILFHSTVVVSCTEVSADDVDILRLHGDHPGYKSILTAGAKSEE
jgi:hypothetical protein